MHYYPFNIADYRKDTTHLKPLDHYIYRTLIDVYYLNEAPIPDRKSAVLKKLSLPESRMPHLEGVLTEFFQLVDGQWHHKRIDEDIEKYHRMIEINRINGAKGGRPKKTGGVRSGKRTIANKKATNKPISINQDNKVKKELLRKATEVLKK